MKNINQYTKIILLILLAFNSVSCNNEDINDIVKNNKSDVTFESSYKLLNITPNIYHNYFDKVDNSVIFSSLKFGEKGEHNVVNHFEIKNENEIKIRLNGQLLDYNQNHRSNNAVQNFYGTKVRFSVENQNPDFQARNDENTVGEIYVPEVIEITNPIRRVGTENSPLLDANNFVIEWNADSDNQEGLVVLAEYFGTSAVPENNTNEHILNTDYIELDNGYFKLNPSIFDGMPNLAHVQIILLRGNVLIEEIEGELYKYVFESHQRLPIILVKDASAIQVIN